LAHASLLYLDDYDVDARLRKLGMSRPPLLEAVGQGELQRSLCTADDFGATPGYFAWAITLRTLRAELRQRHEFENGTFLGIPVSFNSAQTIAIATSSADARTGVMTKDDPVTRTKGPATTQAVVENIPRQLPLDLDEQGVELWYLLFHSSDEGGVYAELSKPADLDGDNQIAEWYERILLGRIDPGGAVHLDMPTPTPSDRIEIPVPRKRR
jgi:hypothetical protein